MSINNTVPDILSYTNGSRRKRPVRDEVNRNDSRDGLGRDGFHTNGPGREDSNRNRLDRNGPERNDRGTNGLVQGEGSDEWSIAVFFVPLLILLILLSVIQTDWPASQ